MNVTAGHCERSAAISFWGIVAIALVPTIVSVATAQYSGGTGEPNDPYQIATAADLIALGETPEDYDKHFILTADIDLSDYDGKDGRPAFQVIGDCYTSSNGITTYVKGTPFAGIFDGNGKTIFHLTSLQADGNLLGLFGGLAQGAEVKNLRVLADIDIDAMDSAVGTLAGYNGSTVTQCSSGGGSHRQGMDDRWRHGGAEHGRYDHRLPQYRLGQRWPQCGGAYRVELSLAG